MFLSCTQFIKNWTKHFYHLKIYFYDLISHMWQFFFFLTQSVNRSVNSLGHLGIVTRVFEPTVLGLNFRSVVLGKSPKLTEIIFSPVKWEELCLFLKGIRIIKNNVMCLAHYLIMVVLVLINVFKICKDRKFFLLQIRKFKNNVNM